MEVSIFLAKVMGLYLIIISVAILVSYKPLNKILKAFANDVSAVFFSGIMVLILGLLVVVSHNIWVANWRVIITVLGWLMLLKGVACLLAPGKLTQWGLKIYNSVAPVLIIIYLVAGIYLTYVGFTA